MFHSVCLEMLPDRKTRFRTEQLSQGVLDDPAWLSPRKGPSDIQYEDLVNNKQYIVGYLVVR